MSTQAVRQQSVRQQSVPRRRLWTTLAIVVGLGAALLVAALTARPEASNRIEFDPENAGANGTRALSRVLDREGVDISVARSADALGDLELSADTVVVVTRPQMLGRSTATALQDQARAADSTVLLLAPRLGSTELFGIDDPGMTVVSRKQVPAACTDPELAPTAAGLQVAADRAVTYQLPGCFTRDDASLLVQPEAGLVLWGAPEAWTNDQILRADNAGLALRVLGQGDRVVWYVPDPADLGAEDAVDPLSLIPDAVLPSLLLLGLTVLGVIAWRGRRFGPLASEPLPVVVHAGESTRALARLQRRAGDRAHAAAALREASRRRAAAQLALGAVDDTTLAAAIAAHTGRAHLEVAQLISREGSAPDTDPELTRLAEALARLDREVRTR